MDAEKQRTASEKEHLARSAAFSSAEAKVKALEKKLSRLVLGFSLKGLQLKFEPDLHLQAGHAKTTVPFKPDLRYLHFSSLKIV